MMKKILFVIAALLNSCSDISHHHDDINKECLKSIEMFNDSKKKQDDLSKRINNNHNLSENNSLTQKILLIDASRSMRESLLPTGERSKIDEVKSIALDLIDKSYSDSEVMSVYSLGNKSNACYNNFIDLTGGSLEENKLLIENLNLGSSVGKSPIVDSVLRVVERHREKSSLPIQILVVTDGKENCISQREAIDKLKYLQSQSGLEIKIHILGVNTDESNNNSLKELANITGGNFILAKNHEEIRQHLPALLGKSHGFIHVIRPDEVDEFTSWRLFDRHSRLIGSYSDDNFGFDNDIPLQSGSYGLCLSVGSDIFVDDIKIKKSEILKVDTSSLWSKK